jgi:NAD-dependent dihydropyrimidine dehydrogenase PreA subunit
MIELVSEARCIGCNKCVQVCPTHVFDAVPGGAPRVARKAECQTCFLCEAYCPADALYVAAEAHEHVAVDEAELERRGLLGVYRNHLGWAQGTTPIERLNEYKSLADKVGSPF